MNNPTVIIAEEPAIQIVSVEEPVSVVVEATGGGTVIPNYFRGIINYDGGHAGTHYGDLAHLDGGGAADGRRNPI